MSDEPVGFTNLVTYAKFNPVNGTWDDLREVVTDDVFEWRFDRSDMVRVINVLPITQKQAAELEQ